MVKNSFEVYGIEKYRIVRGSYPICDAQKLMKASKNTSNNYSIYGESNKNNSGVQNIHKN